MKNKRTLFIVLTAISTIVIITTISLVSLLIKDTLTKNLIEQSISGQQKIAEEAALFLQNEISQIQDKLQLVAELPIIKEGDKDTCYEKIIPIFSTSNDDPFINCYIGESFKDTPIANTASISRLINDREHGAHITITVPILDENGTTIIGTISGPIYFSNLQEKYLNKLRFAKQGYVTLIDDDGTVLFHPNKIFIGNKASDRDPTHNVQPPNALELLIEKALTEGAGVQRYTYAGNIKIGVFKGFEVGPERKWIVNATIPIEDILSGVLSTHIEQLFQLQIVTISAITIVTMAMVLFIINKYVFKRINRLKNAMNHMRNGNLDVQIDETGNDEIGELGMAFKILTKKLVDDLTEQKVIERSKEEFFSIASHELRTPLTAIRGNTSMILEYFSKELTNETARQMLKDIHESSVRLIGIVNEFINTSRLEQGKMTYKKESFAIVVLCEQAKYELQNSAEAANLSLQIIPPHHTIPNVYADKDKTLEIITNLLSNAIKYTKQGTVTVSFEVVKDKVKIKISDTGVGIEEKNKVLLFRKFQQAQSDTLTRNNTEGTGLGLYISKMLATGMGAELKLESSTVGMGSTFTLSLPIEKPNQDT